MKYCTKCGTPCEDGFAFCPKCGNEMVSLNEPTPAEEPAPVEQPKAPAPCEVSPNVAAANAAIASVLAVKADEPAEQPKKEANEEVVEAAEPEAAEVVPVVAAATAVVADEATKEEAVCEEKQKEEAEAAPEGYVYVEDKIPEGGKGRGLAGVSFAFGLMSLLFFWIPGVNFVMFILSILGIIFASAAMKHYRYGLAIAGKTLSLFALVFNLILVAIFAIAVISGFSYFKGVADTFTLYSTQATSLIDTVGKFLSDVFLVK